MTEAASEPTEDTGSAPEPSPEEAPRAEAPAPEPTGPIAPAEARLVAPAFTAKRIATVESTRPSRAFLLVVATVSLVADVASKLWAEKALDGYPGFVSVVDDHLMFILAKNKGGAWGLLQGQNENVRRPFFLLVSVAAIAFIMTLYRRLTPRQHALRWGLPLVLGGALGNVFDRVRYGHVIDFIDYRAEWVRSMNAFVAKYVQGHYVTDHWPTFNIADVAICVGVGLMAVDMFTSRRGAPELVHAVAAPAVPAEASAPAEASSTEAPVEASSTEAPAEASSEGSEAPAAADEESKESA
jgi:signal peptidase II